MASHGSYASQHSSHPSSSSYRPQIDPKHPPGWDPQYENSYPFRRWVKDIRNWVTIASIPAHQQGPLVLLQMGGVARQIVEKIDSELVVNGGIYDYYDNRGPQYRFGTELMIRILEARFKEFDIETQLQAQDALNDFMRLPHETVDTTLARHELVKSE